MARIYISSTFADLKECRVRVYQALRRLEHDVKAMEDYVAQDVRPLDKCLADVAAADVYVGIFAWRYGFIPEDPVANPDRRSITELEYLAAREAGKPCLIFVLDDAAPWSPQFMDSQSGDADAGTRIRTLRDEFFKGRLLSRFRGADELAELVSTAVTRQVGAAAILPAVTAAQQLRQIADHVLLAYSEVDRAIAEAWAAGLSSFGLRVRLSPQALLSERDTDFLLLERDATRAQTALVVLGGSVDQLRTRPASARRVLSLLEARTRCSIALTTVPQGDLPADWPFTRIADLSAQGPPQQPARDLIAAVVGELESRCPGLRAREPVIGLPYVVVAMTAAEAQELEGQPHLLANHVSPRDLERFDELKRSLADPATNRSWTERYGLTRLDWRPLGLLQPMTAILDDVLNRLNGATIGAADRRIKLQYYPIDPWVAPDPRSGLPTGDPPLRPLYHAVAQSGCVAMVDELSLFHPRLAGAQTFLNQSQVSVVTVAPSSPARNAIEELLDTETRRQLGQAYSRFESEFDPRIELRVVEERRLRRWLHANLPETLRQLREPPPNRGRLAGFRNEVGADRQGIANAIFRDGI